MPNNLHAALACVGVIIIVCARGPLSVRLTVSRAVVGAIVSILPELAAQAPVNWSVPVGAWSKDDMLALLNTAFRLMRRAMAARDFGERRPVSEQPGVVANVLSREANAGVNNPLMTPTELNDAIPF